MGDTDAEAYSPTLGGIWGIYRHSRRQLAEGRLVEDATDDTRHDVEDEGLPPDLDADSQFPSFFHFGGAASDRNADGSLLSLSGALVQQIKDSIGGRLTSNGNTGIGDTMNSARGDQRPRSNYLTLLDRYCTKHSSKEVEASVMDDWLDYVDRMQAHKQSSTG